MPLNQIVEDSKAYFLTQIGSKWLLLCFCKTLKTDFIELLIKTSVIFKKTYLEYLVNPK